MPVITYMRVGQGAVQTRSLSPGLCGLHLRYVQLQRPFSPTIALATSLVSAISNYSDVADVLLL